MVLGFLDACLCPFPFSEKKGSAITLAYDTRTKQFVLLLTFLASRTTLSDFPYPSPGIHFFLMYVPSQEVGNDFHGSALYTGRRTCVADGEPLAGWSMISRSPRGRICVMFGFVNTNEAHPAFSGARLHSNNTAEITAMIEALFFLVLMVQ